MKNPLLLSVVYLDFIQSNKIKRAKHHIVLFSFQKLQSGYDFLKQMFFEPLTCPSFRPFCTFISLILIQLSLQQNHEL